MAYAIRKDDPTTTGGIVLEGAAHFLVEGKPAARMGHTVLCPACQSVGQIAEGNPNFLVESRGVALDGYQMHCGCPEGSNRLIATQTMFDVWQGAQPARLPAGELRRNITIEPQWAESIRRQQVANDTFQSPSSLLAQQSAVEPGFHIVQTPTSLSALVMLLFGEASPAVIANFKRLNPHLVGYAKPGQMVVLSDPNNRQCTLEEALLMETAAMVGQVLEPLSDEEAEFMVKHRGAIAGVLSPTSTAIGVGTAVIGEHLQRVQRLLRDIEGLHQKYYRLDGHLKNPAFFAERQRLFRQLDIELIGITKMSIGFPDHPNLKRALGISSRSLVHHWSKAGADMQIPGYATHIEGLAKAAKYVNGVGWIGNVLSADASYLKVQEVCAAGDAKACRKVKFTESGSFIGGLAFGALGSAGASAAGGAVCVAIGAGSAGVGGLVCGLALVGLGSYAGDKLGAAVGEFSGEIIYEAFE